MTWKPQEAKWDWRAYLDAEERQVIQKSDAMLEKIASDREKYEVLYGRRRQLIVNRAIHRAKFDASR